MSAGLAIKHQPLHLALNVHEEQPTISSREHSKEMSEDETIEDETLSKGTFLFGNSLRKTPDCDLDLSECTSEENLTPEIGEQLERIHEERSLSEDLEDVDIFTNSKIARKFEEELRRRLIEDRRESDQRWIAHEKEQIRYLQDSNESMLKFLHKEVERFQGLCKDAKKPVLIVQDIEELKELKAKITLYEEAIKQLEEQLKLKNDQATNVETKVKLTIDRLKEQNDVQADRIRQLSSELNDRNQTVAHLSAQLRNYRLRDAMATAQQRRRASQGSPVLSPTSPVKSFPSKGVVSSSVSITYPGSRSMTMSTPGECFDGPGSIERPSRRRAASGFGK